MTGRHRAAARDAGKPCFVACILPLRRLAIVALIAVAPVSAFGRQTDVKDPAADDPLVIKMMHAQVHALQEYARCLEAPTAETTCEPPRPLQLPAAHEPAGDSDAQAEAMIDSAARALKDAEVRAISAHAHCVRTKRSPMCGPAP